MAKMMTKTILSFTLISCLAISAFSLYDSSSPVVSLDPTSFGKKLSGKGVWLVEFYAPWCGHCKSLKPEWEKAAMALNGILGVAAVDADEHKTLAQTHGIQGFPTIKLFYKEGSIKFVDYKGGRSAKEIIEWGMNQAQKIALKRAGAKPSSSSSSSSGGNGNGGNSFYSKASGVIELNDSNFHKTVTSGDSFFFIEFYAPWCGHCKHLKPTWIELAGALDGKVKVGAVDCTANQATCSEYGIQGFPTIKFYAPGRDGDLLEYEGGRELGALQAFAFERWSTAQPPPKVVELTDQETFVEQCLGHPADKDLDLKEVKPKQLCLLAFLPHILDSKADGRNASLEMLKEIALTYKERPFSWFWAQGGSQPDLEASVGVGGYGYPAFIALNPDKKKYASLRSGFESSHISEFLESVRTGRERVENAKDDEIGVVGTVDAWDGTDGEAPEEDEFSLDELMADDEL